MLTFVRLPAIMYPVTTASQHSVHLTGGYAPRLQAFSWLKPIPLKWRCLVPPASK